MADSADDLLARARNALARWANAKPATSAEWMSATDLVDAVTDLDELLSAGGPLPTDWVPAAGRTVTDVPGPDIVADVREAQRRIEADEIADTWGA